MKIHASRALLPLIVITGLLAVIFYQASWISDYGEAEPLFPIIQEFGQALVEKTKNKKVEFVDLASLLSENRFSKLQSYGFSPSGNDDELIVLRINKTFSFRIKKDGYPLWEKKSRTISSNESP